MSTNLTPGAKHNWTSNSGFSVLLFFRKLFGPGCETMRKVPRGDDGFVGEEAKCEAES
jgi:hypothetical protein